MAIVEGSNLDFFLEYMYGILMYIDGLARFLISDDIHTILFELEKIDCNDLINHSDWLFTVDFCGMLQTYY